MTLDVKGGIKNTAANNSKYVVIDEMLSNSIDSYLIRKTQEEYTPDFKVTFEVEVFSTSLLGDNFDLRLSCTDNGAGFGDDQVKAFVTKDSTYKDYLDIQGIGKCKGAGRIQFFHHFQKLSVASGYCHGKQKYLRTLNVDAETREITETDFLRTTPNSENEIQTKFSVEKLRKSQKREKLDSSELLEDFNADAIRKHLYKSFLQRLITLKNIIKNFSIEIKDSPQSKVHQKLSLEITAADIPAPTYIKELSLIAAYPQAGSLPRIRVTRYSLTESEFPNLGNTIALCANSAIVLSLTKLFLRNPAARQSPINGKFELIFAESDFLEGKVNIQRDGFDIPSEPSPTESIDGDISLQEVINSLEDFVYGIITPKDFNKDELIRTTQENYGITKAMLESTNVKIHYNDTEENIATRVLKKYQEEIVQDTSNLVTVKNQLLALDPRHPSFREKINEISWRYTESIKSLDMTNLSQLVVRRNAMLQVLRHAVHKMLTCQSDHAVGKREDEKIIHNIFFPTGKNSDEFTDHDIWILNEEYHYFKHISSDKSLASLPWKNGEKLFEKDIDDSLQDLFRKNNKDHNLKRPDIAIFNEEGAAIIIEFKAPGVQIQEHTNDLTQYSRLLAAKSGGKLSRFYGYLIGDTLDDSRMPLGWTQFASGMGYFQSGAIDNPQTRTKYGELYAEMLQYDHFITRAESRLEVYKKKLNVDFDQKIRPN